MTATPMVGTTFFGLDISQFTTGLLSMRRRISKRVLLLEFGPDSLLLAEATLTRLGVKLSHVSAFALPPEALDRGVPAEPLKMAGLIQDFCAEKKIPAHRVAVVLPPELAFQRLLDLPANLTTEEAREYVLNPSNALQIPFPLTQTDFDLFPVSTPTEVQQAGDKRLYMLTAIPEVLVDSIVEMLQAADLELQLLELGSHSQLRNHAADLITLAPQQVDLVLELLPDCSNLMLVSCSGLLGSERLAAMRNLPEFEFEPEQQEVAVSSGLMAEDLVFKDENYLPLSELDLHVLVADLRASFERFHLKLPGAQIRRLTLTGVNSSHPLLADLLEEMLGLPVVLSRSSAVTGLAGLSMDGFLMQSGLGRLIGLALGLLPNDQLLACSLEGQKLVNQDFNRSNGAVAIADLLSSSEAQMGLDLVVVEASSAARVTENQKDNDETLSFDADSKAPVPLSSVAPLEADLLTYAADQPDHSVDSQAFSTEAEELSGLLSTAPSLEEVSLEIDLEETNHGSLSDYEGPSSSSLEAEPRSDHEIVDDADSSKEQWPLMKDPLAADGDLISSRTVNGSLEGSSKNQIIRLDEISSSVDDSLPEMEWPLITLIEQVDSSLEKDIEVEDETSECPSIASDHEQEVIESTVVFEDSSVLVSGVEAHSEEFNSDQRQPSISSEQSTESEQSSTEFFDVSASLEETTTKQEQDLLIPGLSLSEEAVPSQQQLNDDVSASDDSASADEVQDLGELRFAKDD